MALPTRPTQIAPVPAGTTTPRASWLMLAVLLLGQFMCIIDVLVTNVAMPSIAASLHASGASLQLVVGGYTIAYAMLLITGARLGDRYGRRRTYLAGVLIFTAASLACALAPDSQALMLPLVLGREEGWPAWGFGCIAAGVVLAVGFVLIERRVAARGGDPLLNLTVLRAPALPSGLVTLAATQIGYGGLLFAYTLHLQAGLGESALRAGLSYLPFAVVFGLAGYNGRRLPAAARRVLVPAGLTVGILAYLALAAGLHGAGSHGAGSHGGITVLTWTGLAAVGLGLGLSVSPLLTQSLTHVPAARAADASGLLTTTVQLGQLLGVAAIGSVYLSHAGRSADAATSAAAMSGTALWLAALSAAGLLAATVMVRAARTHRR